MTLCRSCLQHFESSQLNENSHCPACAAERQRIRDRLTGRTPAEQPRDADKRAATERAKRAAFIPMTTETVLGAPLRARLGIVSAEAVVGMNILRDLMVEIRDLAGGRSQTVQAAMREIRQGLFEELRLQAYDLGADMIVAVSMSYSDFGQRGGAILAYCYGTAVSLEPGATPQEISA